MSHLRPARSRLALVAALLVAASGVIWFVRAGSHARELYRAAEAALGRHDFREASRHLDEYLSLRPDDAEALLRAAQAARRGGDFALAERRLAEAGGHGADA